MPGRRHVIRGLAAAGLLGSAGISGLIREALALGLHPVAPGINKLNGTVTINGRPARVGQSVGSGDTIVTGPDSETIYVIGQDAYLQRANSTVSFSGGAVVDLMRVVTGAILSVFGKGNKKLVVPTATIGIRGTGCYIEAGERQTYFCLCYGSAEVTPGANPAAAEFIETSYHDHPIVINDDPSMPTMQPATVINHTDIELTMLENLVGRWPPFYGRPGPSGY